MPKRLLGAVSLFVLLALSALPCWAAGGVSAQVACTTTTANVLSANPLRHGLIIQNIPANLGPSGSADAYISFGSANAATTSNSFLLTPGALLLFGGSSGSQTPGMSMVPLTDLACITAVGTANLQVVEF